MSVPQEVKLSELYQEVILDHNKKPRNYGKLEDATLYSHGVNPLCGDDYHLYLKVNAKGQIEAVGFEGHGCAISKSSASMMTTAVQDKSVAEAQQVKDAFLKLLTQEKVQEADRQTVGRLKMFEGVRNFPVRVKCATLAWQALADAIKDWNEKKGG